MTAPHVLFTVPRSSPYFEQLWTEAAERAVRDTGLVVDLFPGDAPASAEEWRRALAGYEALITSWDMVRLDETTLPGDGRLRLVAHAAGSVADLVSPELYRRGVRVVSANPVMARSVAEWCLAMTVNGRMNLTVLAGGGRRGVPPWDERYRCGRVEGATVGIWGFGEIARRYVECLRVLRPERIVVCSGHLDRDEAGRCGVVPGSMEDVFAADVVVLLAGLTAENRGRVDAALLAQIRPGAVLINAGRARLVEERAWREAVASGRFQLYQDVYYEEPPRADDPVFQLPNVLLTPHQAGLSSVPHYVPAMLGAVRRFLDTGTLEGEITREQAARMTSNAAAAASA